jgi:CDP-6-deoxy-D-xylo-4-hexulose-3-dehydrase
MSQVTPSSGETLSTRPGTTRCHGAPGMADTCNKRFGRKPGDLPERYDRRVTLGRLGYALKMPHMQATRALAQNDRAEDFIDRHAPGRFRDHEGSPQGVAECLHLPDADPDSEPSWFGCPVILKDTAVARCAGLINFLDQNKIATRPSFPRLRRVDEHRQDVLAGGLARTGDSATGLRGR